MNEVISFLFLYWLKVSKYCIYCGDLYIMKPVMFTDTTLQVKNSTVCCIFFTSIKDKFYGPYGTMTIRYLGQKDVQPLYSKIRPKLDGLKVAII